jgi:hypothetical protein
MTMCVFFLRGLPVSARKHVLGRTGWSRTDPSSWDCPKLVSEARKWVESRENIELFDYVEQHTTQIQELARASHQHQEGEQDSSQVKAASSSVTAYATSVPQPKRDITENEVHLLSEQLRQISLNQIQIQKDSTEQKHQLVASIHAMMQVQTQATPVLPVNSLPQGVCWFCAERGHSRVDRDCNVTCPYFLRYIQENVLTVSDRGNPLWVGGRGGPRYDGIKTPLQITQESLAVSNLYQTGGGGGRGGG